jgi:ankyrin repeat protein
MLMGTEEPVAIAAVEAIHLGDVQALEQLLAEYPGLASAALGGDVDGLGDGGMTRTLLHVATDWPGHYPNGAAIVGTLIAAGADVNGRFTGPHTETALHWAASSDDVDVLDALLDAGADIEAAGAVIGGGTPLADATAFGQWRAARRLVERGARTEIWNEAALGLMDRLAERFKAATRPSPEDVTHALWSACHGGQQPAAAELLEQGADLNWIGYDDLTPLDAAARSGATDLVIWLRSQGAKSADEIPASS